MRDAHTPDCDMRGCERAAQKCGLCAKHKALVPRDAGIVLAAEAMSAAHRIARRHHARWVRYVKAEIAAGRAQ